MTVIAVRDGVIAADRLVTCGSGRSGEVRKIVAVPDHVGGGFAGASGNLAPAQAALEKMGAGRPEEVDGGDYEVIWLLGDGTVRNYEGGGWFSLEAPFQAIGSGAEIALGALHVGADAETAVRAACALHTGCGGTADIERVCCVVE